MKSNEQKIDPIIWAVVFLAVIVAIATIAVTADAKKERYLIEVRTTDGDVKNNGGNANDQEAKRRMVFPDNDYTADHRANDRVFQNGDRRIQPAGDSEGAAGHREFRSQNSGVSSQNSSRDVGKRDGYAKIRSWTSD